MEALGSGSAASRRGPLGTPGWCWRSAWCWRSSAAIGATRIPTDAGVGTLVDTDTATYRATQQVRESFGEEPVVVLVKGDLQQLILTSNIFRLLRLEGCLSGKVPKGAKPIPGPCAELAAARPGRVRRRPGHLPQRGGGPDRRPAAAAVAAGAAGPVPRIPARGRHPLRHHQRSQPRQRRIRRHRRLRPRPRPRHAEGAPRLPLPEQPLGPDRGPAEAGPERSANATAPST